jgi:spermidine synthase
VRPESKAIFYARNSALIGVGLSAILSQVACFRTLFSLAGGNELSIGIALGAWLFLGALGSLLALPLPQTPTSPPKQLATLFLLTCITLPLSIFLLQYFPGWWGFQPGQVASLWAMLLASLAGLAPVAIPLGTAFTVSCRGSLPGKMGVSWVYITEAVGSGLGGLLGSLALTPFMDSLQLTALTVIACALSAILALTLCPRSALRNIMLVLALVFMVAPLSGFFNNNLTRWHQQLLAERYFPGLQVLQLSPSRHGELLAVRQQEITSLYSNGQLIASYPNPEPAEETAHLPLLVHPNPKRVLLVGGGLSGELEEMLKEPIEKLVYLEIDPKQIEMGEELLGSIPKDDRLQVRSQDLRQMLRENAQSPSPETFDLVILNLGDPSNAEINRNYTQQAMALIKGALAPGGMLAFFATADENYIGKELAGYLTNLRDTAQSVFARVKYLPGARVLFIAGDEQAEICTDPAILSQRLAERHLHLTYIDARYLTIRLMPDRFRLLTQAMEETSLHQVNRDDRPVAYFYDLVLFTSLTSANIKKLLLQLLVVSRLWWLLIPAFIGIFALSAGFRRNRRRLLNSLVLVVGAINISMTVIYLVAYQTLLGYIYQQIALLFAVFMTGLAIGGIIPPLLARSAKKGPRRTKLALYISLWLIAILCLGGPKLVFSPWTLPFSSALIFILLGLQAILGGMVFSCASLLSADRTGKKIMDGGRIGGLLHAADSLGAMLGSIAASILLLPLIGLTNTSYLLSALIIGGAIILTCFRSAFN